MQSAYTVLVLTATFISAVLFYLYCRWKLSYWSRRGVEQLPGSHWLFGHYKEGVLLRTAPGWHLGNLYRRAHPDAPFVGFYIFHKPCLLLRDPKIIKQILVTDFDDFADRNFSGSTQKESLGMKNLFGLKNPAWRYVRRRITPTLTNYKLREMLPLMFEATQPMLAHAAGAARSGTALDAQDISHRYAADLVANVVLGTRTDSFHAPGAYTQAALAFFCGFKRMVALMCVFFVPAIAELANWLRAPFYFNFSAAREMFWPALREREAHDKQRGDFLDSLLMLKNGPQDPIYEFSGDNLLFQAGMFYSGFESSAVATAFTLLELARRPELQAQAREDVRRAVATHGWGYAALRDMRVLGRCLAEALRLYPPVTTLDRCALRDYQILGTDVTIKKGTAVYISVQGLQSDPKHFPEPDRFDPERFAESSASPSPDAYMPFGRGPRMCVSVRGGELHVLVVVASILAQFELSVPRAEGAGAAPRLDARSTITAAASGMNVLFRELNPSPKPAKSTVTQDS